MTTRSEASSDASRAAAVRRARYLLGILASSPFAHLSRWPAAVVVVARGERRVVSRGEFAAWASANDLGPLARECLNRNVSPGAVLVFLSVDEEMRSGVAFTVVDIQKHLRSTKNA